MLCTSELGSPRCYGNWRRATSSILQLLQLFSAANECRMVTWTSGVQHVTEAQEQLPLHPDLMVSDEVL